MLLKILCGCLCPIDGCQETMCGWDMGFNSLVAGWPPQAADVRATTSHIAPGTTKILFHEICLRMQQHQHQHHHRHQQRQRLWQPKSLLILESLFCAGNKQNCARLPPHMSGLGVVGVAIPMVVQTQMHHHIKRWCERNSWQPPAGRSVWEKQTGVAAKLSFLLLAA